MKATARAPHERHAHGVVVARALSTLVCIGLASLGSSCNLDPVQHAAVAALGDEDASRYPVKSQFHRPGEPCVLCHSDSGGAEPKLALGGTIFWGPDSSGGGVPNAYVYVSDGTANPRCVVTNCAGNFFVKGDRKSLTFPLMIKVKRNKNPGGANEQEWLSREMNGHIGREPSCGTCHLKDIVDFGSPGNIRLFSAQKQLDDAKAAGEPIEAIDPAQCPGDVAPVLACPEDR